MAHMIWAIFPNAVTVTRNLKSHIFKISLFSQSYLKFQFCSKLQNLQNRAIVLFTEFVSPCFYFQKKKWIRLMP